MKWCYSLEYYFLFNGTAQRQDRRKKPRQYRVEGPCSAQKIKDLFFENPRSTVPCVRHGLLFEVIIS